MKANQAELCMRAMCKTLRVSPSGYYDWLERPDCAQAQANAVLLEQICQAHADSDATYGVPRIQAELADQGIKAGHNRIASVMRAHGLRGVSRRRGWCVTTKRDKDLTDNGLFASSASPTLSLSGPFPDLVGR